MRYAKKITIKRKKSINRKKLTKGGYNWRTPPPSMSMKKKNKKLRYRARGTKKTNK